jgi:hypothetical protein
MPFRIEHEPMIRISTDHYQVECPKDRPFLVLKTAAGEYIAMLFVGASVHTLTGRDDTTKLGAWELSEPQYGVVTLSIEAESSVWASKTFVFDLFDNRIEYHVRVFGDTEAITEVTLLGGYMSAVPRWGAGFFWSGQDFNQGFNPEPTCEENWYFPPDGGSVIDLLGVPIPGRDSWFFTPPPFCYVVQIPGERWMGIGVQATPGEHQFTEYRYHGAQKSFYLSLSYEGQTRAANFESPTIGFDFAPDPYAALRIHAEHNAIPHRQPQNTAKWWTEPIFCGWGAQCYLSAVAGGRAPDFARQEHYEHFMRVLEENGVAPGIVVLDDKWQTTYGDNHADPNKWHDIRGFIRAQHDAGRKVLLWLKVWDPEGLPAEECITNRSGVVLSFDPTNPAFQQRLREQIQRMLTDYDADGYKLDFTARIPTSPGVKVHGTAFGLELMRAYLEILYTESKRLKPDALIMAHTPHPYLADVVDMIRLNDVNTAKDVNAQMIHRAKVARAALPDVIIDTDNWPMPNITAWRDYVRLQPDLGVPSLYFATHVDSTREQLTADDYQLIRDSWARWRAKNGS